MSSRNETFRFTSRSTNRRGQYSHTASGFSSAFKTDIYSLSVGLDYFSFQATFREGLVYLDPLWEIGQFIADDAATIHLLSLRKCRSNFQEIFLNIIIIRALTEICENSTIVNDFNQNRCCFIFWSFCYFNLHIVCYSAGMISMVIDIL